MRGAAAGQRPLFYIARRCLFIYMTVPQACYVRLRAGETRRGAVSLYEKDLFHLRAGMHILLLSHSRHVLSIGELASRRLSGKGECFAPGRPYFSARTEK